MTETRPNERRGGIPRGLSTTGPVLFSYGFRPFFLAAAIWAVITMGLWIGALTGMVDIAASYGTTYWHAHEMLFGFASAVLAGFLMTAIPNWTGRLPVSGKPLVCLFLVWVAGRLLFLLSDQVGEVLAVAADTIFLPVFLFICAREIVAGRKWKDLKMIFGLLSLALANIAYHAEVLGGYEPVLGIRLALAAYIVMILIVGGRIIPSFTHNWIAKRGMTTLPVAYNRFDTGAIVIAVAALAGWIALRDGPIVAVFAGIAAVVHLVRLWRWKGWRTTAEILVTILHIAYLFVPMGFIAIAFAAIGLFEETSAVHVLGVGTVATMMLAVMTRVTRGHTGRVLTASSTTAASYGAILLAALLRPSAEFFPEHMTMIHGLAGISWIVAFGLYVLEYGPMLTKVRRAA